MEINCWIKWRHWRTRISRLTHNCYEHTAHLLHHHHLTEHHFHSFGRDVVLIKKCQWLLCKQTAFTALQCTCYCRSKMNLCLGITAVPCAKSNTKETSQLYNLSAYKWPTYKHLTVCTVWMYRSLQAFMVIRNSLAFRPRIVNVLVRC